jgi:hypothetical protein
MRTRPPKAHPSPYTSQLWPHLETIRTLRRRRKTWRAIAKHLEDACGIKLGVWTVRNFFKRSTSGSVPLGFRNAQATRESEKPSPATLGLRAPAKPLEDSDGDPFSTKTIPFDPWKPRSEPYE